MRPRRMRIASEDTDPAVREHEPSEDMEDHEDPRRISALQGSLLLVGGVIALLYFGVAITVDLLVDPDEMRSWIAPRASAALGRAVTIGDVGLSVLPRPSARLRDVRVENLPGYEGPRLAHIEEARLDVAWLPLLVGRVHVHRVVFGGLGVHLAVDPSGRSNFGDLIPERAEAAGNEGPAPFTWGIERVVVSGGALNFFDAPRGGSFAVTGADMEAAVVGESPAGWRAAVTVRSDSLHVWALDPGQQIVRLAGPVLRLAARGDASWGTVDIDEGRVELAGEALAVRGRLNDVTGPAPSFDLELVNDAMSAGVLATWIPADVRARHLPLVEGTLGVTLRIRGAGGYPPRPRLHGAVRLDDVALRMGGQLIAEDIGGLVAVTPESIALDSLTGRFAGGPFDLSGVINREGSVASLVARARPDLDRLDRLGLVPGGTTLSGDALLDLSIAGPLDAPDSIQVVGVASLDGFQVKHPRFGEPLYVPAGEVTILGQEALWSELSVLVGRDALTTTGTIRDLSALWSEHEAVAVEVSVTGPRLDLDAVLPTEASPPATYARVALAHLGGLRIGERTAAAVAGDMGLARPERLGARGWVEFDLDTLSFRGNRLTSLAARLDLSDTTLAVSEATFGVWGGGASGSLELGLGSGVDAPFRLTVMLEGVEAEDLFSATTPLGDAVSGRLSLDLELEGSTDRALLPVGRDLTGRVHLSIVDGAIGGTGPNLALSDFLETDDWSSVSFTQAVADFTVADRALDIEDLRLLGAPGRIALNGLLGLEGYAELSLGVSIPPERLEGLSLRRTGIGQTVLEQLRAVGSPLELGLRLEGPVQALQVEADASSAVALARVRPGS